MICTRALRRKFCGPKFEANGRSKTHLVLLFIICSRTWLSFSNDIKEDYKKMKKTIISKNFKILSTRWSVMKPLLPTNQIWAITIQVEIQLKILKLNNFLEIHCTKIAMWQRSRWRTREMFYSYSFSSLRKNSSVIWYKFGCKIW